MRVRSCAGHATIGAPSSCLTGRGRRRRCRGRHTSQVRIVHQLEVLDVAVDAAVVEHQVEFAEVGVFRFLPRTA
jgi:hypothetical protein